MTVNSIWIDWLILICQIYFQQTEATRPFREQFFLLPLFHLQSIVLFSAFHFFSSSYLALSPSFFSSSWWIIHGVIHNLGEAARDLHSSLCHWVLFGGIFNNCLIYQIDWELGAQACVQQSPICLIMARVSAIYFPKAAWSAWLLGELPTS